VHDPLQQEIDEIYSLLAYALVYFNWQPGNIPRENRRGYNVGAVLVNRENEVVHYGLNCINSTDNATQHGEVRTIMEYLDKTRQFNLEGCAMYTTLEPCIMCAGMMTMTNVSRVVYGQKDVDFSNGLERLALDTQSLGGYAPFKRTTVSDGSHNAFRIQLDQAYQRFLETDPEKILAKFLTTQEAESIYKNAANAFFTYQVKYPENDGIYAGAKTFYDREKQYPVVGKG
jgi:tRNA(Arg) A34 adenosine deaminase TadA